MAHKALPGHRARKGHRGPSVRKVLKAWQVQRDLSEQVGRREQRAKSARKVRPERPVLPAHRGLRDKQVRRDQQGRRGQRVSLAHRLRKDRTCVWSMAQMRSRAVPTKFWSLSFVPLVLATRADAMALASAYALGAPASRKLSEPIAVVGMRPTC